MGNLSRKQWAVAWCAAVITATAVAVVFGLRVTIGNGVAFLLACLVPPAIMFLIWRPPPSSVGQMLYDVNARSKSETR